MKLCLLQRGITSQSVDMGERGKLWKRAGRYWSHSWSRPPCHGMMGEQFQHTSRACVYSVLITTTCQGWYTVWEQAHNKAAGKKMPQNQCNDHSLGVKLIRCLHFFFFFAHTSFQPSLGTARCLVIQNHFPNYSALVVVQLTKKVIGWFNNEFSNLNSGRNDFNF